MKTITRHLLTSWACGALFAVPAFAVNTTVTLSIPTMDCPVCPITIKKALAKLAGVSRTEVSYEKRIATVTFDDGKTIPTELTRATKEAGYPSTIVAQLEGSGK